ncbi:MAG: hypothetical protein A2068_10225 [Ignavibacteria bacterium GWB2_35_6b]|nr:MAG: hypothetical protein A2068_10225 [Ignavibacteria bacterium GWB2_35_6b]
MIKILIDKLLSIFILIISFPFLLFILPVVSLLTKESPILTQNRKLTLEKKNIKIWKIRTIRETDKFKQLETSAKNIYNKHEFEKYVPLFCKWLRQSGIDEIPQLINVIKGDLSIVGPRPMIEKDLLIMKEHEPEIYKKRMMLNSKPGITGYWQLFGVREKGSENLVEMDSYYEQKKSFILDLKIILKTFVVMLRAKHSDSIVTDKFAEVNKKVETEISELSFE